MYRFLSQAILQKIPFYLASMKLDKEAAGRFIKSAMKENQEIIEAEKANKKRLLEEVVDSSSSEEETSAPPRKHAKKESKKEKKSKKNKK